MVDQNRKPSVLVDGEFLFPTDRILAQLERVLTSEVFSRSERLVRFLRFSVEQALSGHADCLKEQTIGVEVFDRKPDYDPRIDPIVRVEARRLRSKLNAYYAANNGADDVFIDLPKGAYVPVFRPRAATGGNHVESAKQTTEVSPAEKSIAVLPFVNLTPEADEDYFSD